MKKATSDRVRLHGGDYALTYAAWALHENEWDDFGDQASAPAPTCAYQLMARNKFAAKQKAARLLRAGKVADGAKLLLWPQRASSTAPYGRAILEALEAAELFRSDGDRQSVLSLATKLCGATGFDATWGETAEASPELEPLEFVRAYDGPMGRVAAVQTQFSLSVEHAAEMVREADKPRSIRTKEAPTVGDILARCDADVRRVFEELTQELIKLRRVNAALRTLTHEYLPTDG